MEVVGIDLSSLMILCLHIKEAVHVIDAINDKIHQSELLKPRSHYMFKPRA